MNDEIEVQISPGVSPFPERGKVAEALRHLNVHQHITFPVGNREGSIRAAASYINRSSNRKYLVHKYPDGSIGVWRES